MDKLIELLQYPFVARAFAAGILISLCAALLGAVLVLKHYSLIGHGLADVGFASLSVAVAFGLPPMLVSVPVVVVASFIIMAYSQRKGIAGDTALGVTATSSLALGIIVTSLKKGFNTDVYNYMFGSILAMSTLDIVMSVILAVLVIGLYVLFYNRIFLITADENFAVSAGINVGLYQFLISFLTALTVVIGMKMTGTLLISSLIIVPAVTARRITALRTGSFKSLILLTSIISVICFIAGMCVSILANIPTGAGIVAVSVGFMLVVSVVGGIIVRVKRI
ncbi:MAG: metal ABC transporter permease [Oscillospiraceae bacterium]|nr:metal ABC transporter permease [Oscillospiraceae bacterium]